MPVRSPSPKHFRWRSRTSFVEVIPPSSFIGWDGQSRRTLYSATSLRRTRLDVDRTPTHSRERVADRIDLNQGWSASGHKPEVHSVRNRILSFLHAWPNAGT